MSRKRKRVFSLEDAEREVQEESEMMGDLKLLGEMLKLHSLSVVGQAIAASLAPFVLEAKYGSQLLYFAERAIIAVPPQAGPWRLELLQSLLTAVGVTVPVEQELLQIVSMLEASSALRNIHPFEVYSDLLRGPLPVGTREKVFAFCLTPPQRECVCGKPLVKHHHQPILM